MRACRRKTPPPNARPQGAGEWTEVSQGDHSPRELAA